LLDVALGIDDTTIPLRFFMPAHDRSRGVWSSELRSPITHAYTSLSENLSLPIQHTAPASAGLCRSPVFNTETQATIKRGPVHHHLSSSPNCMHGLLDTRHSVASSPGAHSLLCLICCLFGRRGTRARRAPGVVGNRTVPDALRAAGNETRHSGARRSGPTTWIAHRDIVG